MIETLKTGDRLHFDPSLSVTVGSEGLFQVPRVVFTVGRVEKFRVEEPAIELSSWQLTGEDGSHLLLIRDKQADLWFLLRLVAEERHSGNEPAFLGGDDYPVAGPGGKQTVYGFYSDPMVAEARQSPWAEPDFLLMRVFVRPVDGSDEFLWIMLRNDQELQHYLGVIIHPAQVMRKD